jgi:hypothetical protein
MARLIAAGHAAVGRIHNRAATQRGNISPPQIEVRLYGLQLGKLHASPALIFFLQIFILYPFKFLADWRGWAHIHQTAQKILLLLFPIREGNLSVSWFLLQQCANQALPSFRLVHLATPL